MTTYVGKSCSFGLLFVSCMDVCEGASFLFGFERGMWDLCVLVPRHCLSFYFVMNYG